MAQWLKQSTATNIKFGPFVSVTDADTEMTALSIAQADILLSKNGGALTQTHNAAGATHDAHGMYIVPLDTTDTDTLGRLKLCVHKATALWAWQDFVVVSANVFDSLIGGGDVLDISVIQLLGTAWLAPGVAGTPDVNAKLIGGTSQTGRDNGTGNLPAVVNDYATGKVPLKPATAGRTIVVDAAGLADANMVKAGPTGSGTAQTAKDLGISLPGIAPDAAGGLPTVAAGGLKLNKTVDLTSGQQIDLVNAPNSTAIAAMGLGFWNVLEANVGIIANSFGAKLHLMLVNASGFVSSILMRWKTDDAPGTPLALTSAFLVQADAVKIAGATPGTQQTGDNYAVVKSGGTGDLVALKAVTPASVIAAKSDLPSVSGLAVEANVQGHVTDALNTAIPGSPTANSIFDYIKNKLSQYAGGDTAGTTTLLGRIIGTLLTGNHSPQSGDSFAVVKSGGTGDLVALKAVTPASVIAAKSDLPSTTGMALEANVQGHVTDALNAAMPGTPTSGSLFDRVKTVFTTLSGITSLANWLRGLARTDTMNATAKAELNAGGGGYDEAFDSLQIIGATVTSGGGGGLTEADVRHAVGMSTANLDAQLAAILLASGGGTGTGSVLYVPDRAVDPSGNPLDGVYTWVTTSLTDPAIGLQAAAYTNALGVITPGFMLDPGPYAVWRQRGGDTFINPQLVTVTP
jgi:hypothetical protein